MSRWPDAAALGCLCVCLTACATSDSGGGDGRRSAGGSGGATGGGAGASQGTGASAGDGAGGSAVGSGGAGANAGAIGSGGTGATAGAIGAGGTAGTGGTGVDAGGGSLPVGAHDPPPITSTGPVTAGGTMTFLNIGAPGWWGRRIEATEGDPRCNVQSEVINYGWGTEFCCRTRHEVTTDRLSPYNEQVSIVLDGPMKMRQFVVYQPVADAGGAWTIRSLWDRRSPATAVNLAFVGGPSGKSFTGDFGNNCSWHAVTSRKFTCGTGSDPYCPGSGLDYYGWEGSKLFVILASMPYTTDPALAPLTCLKAGEDEKLLDAPWIGLGASELTRDGWAGYHPCHCFANTNGGLGDGCGQINAFEVVGESSGSQWGNRDVISTGLRSFQLGHLGGNTCGIATCTMDHFPADAQLVDACKLLAITRGAVLDSANRDYGICPMWRRPLDDRYFLILLDEPSRTVQVAIVHPQKLPPALAAWLPTLPQEVPRSAIDALVSLRLPQ